MPSPCRLGSRTPPSKTIRSRAVPAPIRSTPPGAGSTGREQKPTSPCSCAWVMAIPSSRKRRPVERTSASPSPMERRFPRYLCGERPVAGRSRTHLKGGPALHAYPVSGPASWWRHPPHRRVSPDRREITMFCRVLNGMFRARRERASTSPCDPKPSKFALVKVIRR